MRKKKGENKERKEWKGKSWWEQVTETGNEYGIFQQGRMEAWAE